MSKGFPERDLDALKQGGNSRSGEPRAAFSSGKNRTRDRRRRKPFPYQTIAAAIQRAIESPALRRRLNAGDIIRDWESIAGQAVAQHVQPMGLDKGVLTLQADSAVWRQEVSLLKPELARRLAEHFGAERVRQIRIR